MLAVLFFIAGKVASTYNIPKQGWVTMLFFGAVTLFSLINPTGMTTRENIALYIVGALFGIFMTNNISNHIQRVPWLSKALVYIGDNTLAILTWHLICFKLTSLLIIKINHLSIAALASFPVISEYSKEGWWLIYTITGLIFPLIINLGISKAAESIKSIYKKSI